MSEPRRGTGKVPLGEVTRVVIHPGEPSIERGFAGDDPGRQQLAFRAPESVVDQGHGVRHAIGEVADYRAQVESNRAAGSRHVLDAAFAARHARAPQLHELRRILRRLLPRGPQQMPSAEQPCVHGEQAVIDGAHVAR